MSEWGMGFPPKRGFGDYPQQLGSTPLKGIEGASPSDSGVLGGTPLKGVSPSKPKLKKFHLFLRNCKVLKKFDLDVYFLIYLSCGREMIVLECTKTNECIETVRLRV